MKPSTCSSLGRKLSIAVDVLCVGELEDPVTDLDGQLGDLDGQVLLSQPCVDRERTKVLGDPEVVLAPELVNGLVGPAAKVDLHERRTPAVDADEGQHRGAHEARDRDHLELEGV